MHPDYEYYITVLGFALIEQEGRTTLIQADQPNGLTFSDYIESWPISLHYQPEGHSFHIMSTGIFMFPWTTTTLDAKPEITLTNGKEIKFSHWQVGSLENHKSFNIKLPISSCQMGLAFPFYGEPWKIQLTETKLKEIQSLIQTFSEIIARE
jgi:hypothetical protein